VRRNSTHFLEESEKAGDLQAGGYGRVLKVIQFPWLQNAHEQFLHKFQHVEFFSRDSKTGQEREFKHTSEPFRKAVDKLSFHVEKLFEAMLRSRQTVFVARTSEDASDDREAIIREIRAAGFALSPPPYGAIPKGVDTGGLAKFIREGSVTVHLLGKEYDPVVRNQIDLALTAEKRVIFCLARQHETAAGEQKKLIEEIRNNNWNLANGTFHLLEGRSSATLHQDLIGLLAPPRQTGTASPDDAARVYLLCDPNSPEDAGFARDVQEKIKNKEHFQVELPQAATDFSSPGAQHERLLQDCDGLLLYHEKAPQNWYKRNFADLLMAEDRRPRELKSKALLISGSNIAMPGLTVIQRHDPFDLQQLEPFLAPLRNLQLEPGGAANAGR
jgi:hypothetical protein